MWHGTQRYSRWGKRTITHKEMIVRFKRTRYCADAIKEAQSALRDGDARDAVEQQFKARFVEWSNEYYPAKNPSPLKSPMQDNTPTDNPMRDNTPTDGPMRDACDEVLRECSPGEQGRKCFLRLQREGSYRHPDKGGDASRNTLLNLCKTRLDTVK